MELIQTESSGDGEHVDSMTGMLRRRDKVRI